MSHKLLNKVPAVTLLFWLIKMMSTTVGETGADFLAFNLHLGLIGTSLVMGVVLLIALFFQIKSKIYTPWLYWITVVCMSVFGTLVTDTLVDLFGIPLEITTIIFSIMLIGVFSLWYAKEKTLSIHTIYTKQREIFYWIVIVTTFALGTGAGDLIGEGFQLGYLTSTLIFGGVIGCIALFHVLFKLNSVLCFWIAYILTRPLGASIGDYLSQTPSDGGLGFGSVKTSVVFLALISISIIYLTLSKKDTIVIEV